MASVDNQFVSLITDIRIVLNRLRIVESIGKSGDQNFIPGKGESVYSTFLRAVGFIKYTDDINSKVPLEQQIADGQNIVDRLLKVKDKDADARKKNIAEFLSSLQQQLEKYVRDVGLIRLRRIRKKIGTSSLHPRTDSTKTTVTFTGDVDANTRLVNKELAKYDHQRDGIGQLVQEIDLLSLFLRSLNSLVSDITSTGTTVGGLTSAQPLGSFGGPFVAMIKAQSKGYEDQLDALVDQRVALNADLLALQKKMRLIRTGLEMVTKEPIALLSVVNALLYLIKDVGYTCKECRFFSLQPVQGQADLSGLTADQKLAQQSLIAQAQQRTSKFIQSLGVKTGVCIYRAANIPTTTEMSCNEVWGLINNDFWRASQDNTNGRIDIVTKARDKLDPRKK